MKRIILISFILLVSLCLLVSCADNTDTPDDNGYDTRFDNTAEDAVACYFSLLTEDGFGNYLLAFPTEFVEGYQSELEYDDETFKIAIDNATESLHINRDETYQGAEYNIEYTLVTEKELDEKEKKDIISDLVNYCYMTENTIEKVAEQVYEVHTYGVTESGEKIMEQTYNKILNLVYIKEDGWYISPNEFELP